jgi:hypothetical protein
MKINKKYNLKDIDYSFIITDILMFCLYCLQERKGKYRKRIEISNLHKNLYHYDYSYKSVEYDKLKKIIIIMFPLYKNNYKRTKLFKINTLLVNYWGERFGIKYEFHKETFLTFKSLEDGKR